VSLPGWIATGLSASLCAAAAAQAGSAVRPPPGPAGAPPLAAFDAGPPGPGDAVPRRAFAAAGVAAADDDADSFAALAASATGGFFFDAGRGPEWPGLNDVVVGAVPEPVTLALIGAAVSLLGLGLGRRGAIS